MCHPHSMYIYKMHEIMCKLMKQQACDLKNFTAAKLQKLHQLKPIIKINLKLLIKFSILDSEGKFNEEREVNY